MFFTACARGGFSCPRPQLRRAVPCGALCLQLRAVAARSAGAWVFLWWGAALVGAQCGGEEIREGRVSPTKHTKLVNSSHPSPSSAWAGRACASLLDVSLRSPLGAKSKLVEQCVGDVHSKACGICGCMSPLTRQCPG